MVAARQVDAETDRQAQEMFIARKLLSERIQGIFEVRIESRSALEALS